LTEKGIEVVAQLACEAVPNLHSRAYLQVKKEKTAHALMLDGSERTRSPLTDETLKHPGAFLANAEHP
jgi:hypothetical protein